MAGMQKKTEGEAAKGDSEQESREGVHRQWEREYGTVRETTKGIIERAKSEDGESNGRVRSGTGSQKP